jgi:hypothetical protein
VGTIITLVLLWTSLWMYLESRKFGYDKRDIQGMAAIGPRGWFFGGLLLWIVAFPLYLASREKLKAAGEARRQKLASEGVEIKPPSKAGPAFAIIALSVITLAVIGSHAPKTPATAALAAAPLEPPATDKPPVAPAPAAPVEKAPAAAMADEAPSAPATPRLKLSQFRSYTRTCKSDVTRDMVKGEPRFLCQRRGVVPSIFEAMGAEKNLSKVTLMIGVDTNRIPETMMMGFNFIRDVTGRKVGEIAPDGWIAEFAKGPQSFSYDGLTIETEPYPPIGMIRFTAIAE